MAAFSCVLTPQLFVRSLGEKRAFVFPFPSSDEVSWTIPTGTDMIAVQLFLQKLTILISTNRLSIRIRRDEYVNGRMSLELHHL